MRQDHFRAWRKGFDWGIATFCSHRTYRTERERIHRALAPWQKGQEFFALEPSREHGLHVSSAELECELRALIELADIVFVAATIASRNSGYVKFEISTAKGLGVPILPVQFSDQKAFPRDFIESLRT